MTPRLATLIVLTSLSGVAAAVPPPVVPWREAGAHVGEMVTVEGKVIAAETTDDTCVLEFAPGDPVAFRAVLLLPILSTGPRHPERLYRGRQVRATGRVQQFHGRPEMVLRSTDQIQVTDDDGTSFTAAEPEVPPATPESRPSAARQPEPAATRASAPAVPTPSAPQAVPSAPPSSAATAPPATAAGPPVAPAAPPEPPARGLVEAVQQKMASLTPCERARTRWRDAAAIAGARAAALCRCLDAAGYDCRAERKLLGPALSALGVSEDEIADACR